MILVHSARFPRRTAVGEVEIGGIQCLVMNALMGRLSKRTTRGSGTTLVTVERSKLVILGIGDEGLGGLDRPSAANPRGIRPDPGCRRRSWRCSNRCRRGRSCSSPTCPRRSSRCGSRCRPGKPVLVSSGDPLFYGVARYLCDRLGKESFEILPHVSSMQLAFARVKESWEDAYLTNLAGRPIEAVLDRIRTAEKVGLFSSDELPPPRAGSRAAGTGNRLFPCLRLREPGFPGRTGHAGRARRPGGDGVQCRSTC